MTTSKIEIKIGAIEFSGEGEPAWLSAELDKILKIAPALSKIVPAEAPTPGGDEKQEMKPDPEAETKALGAFLRDKGATTNQVKKFLATSVWLESKGKNRLQTSDVTKALKDNNQTRLGNPSKCLGDSISKGHCERDGKEFFVTEDGRRSL